MYEQPVIQCKNIKADPKCEGYMVLPFFPLPPECGDDPTPEEKDEYLARWPPGTWRATIGCPSCGKILLYDAEDVEWYGAPYEEKGQHHASTTCYRVEHRCATLSCRVPVIFHTVLNVRISSQAALLEKLDREFFSGKCRNGHNIFRVPRERYRLDRVFDAIPSET